MDYLITLFLMAGLLPRSDCLIRDDAQRVAYPGKLAPDCTQGSAKPMGRISRLRLPGSGSRPLAPTPYAMRWIQHLSHKPARSLMMIRKMPPTQQLLVLVPRIHPDFKPVWDAYPPDEQASLAAYLLPHGSKKDLLSPTRPKIIKWYCPFASQTQFPSGHRYCINVFVGCAHRCSYCYVTGGGVAGSVDTLTAYPT